MFSIIIPTYNGEKTIKRCLNSLIMQLKDDDEIIIIDDCSLDNTVNMIYTLQTEEIKVFLNKKNMGVSYTRNIGIKNAKQKYLIFVDCDDFCDENMLKNYREIITKYSPELICLGLNYIDEISKIQEKNVINFTEGLYFDDDMYSKMLEYEKQKLLFSPCNKVYLNSIINKNNLKFNEIANNMEDYEFNCKYIEKIKNAYFSSYAFYNYVYSDNNSLSSNYVEELYSRYETIKDLRRNLYSSHIETNILQKELIKLNSEYLFLCLNNLYKDGSKLKYKDRIKVIKEIIKEKDMKEYVKIQNRNEQNYERIMLKIIKLKNAVLIDCILLHMHSIKRSLGKFYKKNIRRYLRKK